MVRRKHDVVETSHVVHKPPPGHQSFKTGAAVRDALATGTRQAIVSLQQQILTLTSSLPLPISHPTVVILQHYLEVSPTLEEIFTVWRRANESKDDKLAESAVNLTASILRILTPVPFFHAQLVGVINKIVNPVEPYHDLLNRLVASGKRENVFAGVSLAAAAIAVDKPDPASPVHGRLALRVWAVLVEGGSAKLFGKLLNMRRKTKDGETDYGDRDPLERPDIRHHALGVVLPLLGSTAFHATAKPILPSLFSGLAADPAITVSRTLTALWQAVYLPTPGLARRVALVLFDEAALDHLVRLTARMDKHEGRSVGEMAAAFLDTITTNPSRGICFPDEGWYPRQDSGRGLHNRILSNAVRKLGARAVDDARVGAWAINVFRACPELVAGYWAHSALSIEPRLGARWLATMAYVGRIVSLPPPPRSAFCHPVPRGSTGEGIPRPPPAVDVAIESILPSPLTRVHLTKGLQHASPLVQHATALSLARCLQKLVAVQQVVLGMEADVDGAPGGSGENAWAVFRRELELEARRRVPEVSTVIAFAQKAAQRPDEVETPAEQALATRAALLTEAALRLFGLYHKAMPTLAGEARFDVGKLLVSASSANAERRARREAREGSVVSDSGSVGSIGTLGTIGMGGGFGHTRGDVQGFEALSQLHVVQLLTDVKDWQWTNKAAGSQYTYLYHILQLHLSTFSPITQAMTSSLLSRLLTQSLLFEHDPAELDLWLGTLPYASATASGPMLLAQQIHLLSFLDECARRALKTAHRYIEETRAMARDADASPLLVVMLEQLGAKITGMHIATEAAAVVMLYIRRVLLALLGKQRSRAMARAAARRLREVVVNAQEAGQPRQGLLEIVDAIDGDLQMRPTKPGGLVDDADYTQRSFERRVLDAMPLDELRFAEDITTQSAERHGQWLLHAVEADASDSLLSLVLLCLQQATGASARRLKSAVFENAAMQALLVGSRFAATLDAIAGALTFDVFDRTLAEPYTHHVMANGGPVARFARFFTPAQQVEALQRAADTRDAPALAQLVPLIEDATVVAARLDALVDLGAASALAVRLASISPFDAGAFTADKRTLRRLVDEGAYSLLANLARDNRSKLAKIFAKREPDVQFLPVLEKLPRESSQAALSVKALSDATLNEDIHRAATNILSDLHIAHPAAAEGALAAVDMRTFTVALARLAARVPSTHLVDIGLQVATRSCSNQVELSATDKDMMIHLIEPIVIAVVEDRLDVDVALDLATAVVQASTAATVRQNLQALLASKPVTRQAASPALVRLLHALFMASTYTSCQPAFVEPLLPLYRGTLSASDTQLLAMFHAFERHRRLSAASILRTWSGTGGQSGRALDALTSLNAGKVWATCVAFPLRRGMAGHVTERDESDDLYDPLFVLPLFAAALHEELTGLDWVEVLRTNVLGLAVCALASRHAGMRAFAASLLSRATALVGASAFHEQLQLLHTLELVKHASEPRDDGSQPRLPTLTTLFLAHALRSQASPAHFLYPLASRFLLQRATFDAFDVPLLYLTLYSAAPAFKRERAWAVRLVRDGTRAAADWRVLRRRSVFALLASLYQASVDSGFRQLVLQAVGSMARVPDGARWLLHKGGAAGWIETQLESADASERALLLNIIESLSISAGPQGRRALETVLTRLATSDDFELLTRVARRLHSAPLLTRLVHRLSPVVSGAALEHLFALSLDVDASADVAQTIVDAAVARGGKLGDWIRRQAEVASATRGEV